MPATLTHQKNGRRSADPLKPLADAIGTMLAGVSGKKGLVPELANQLSDVLHKVLEAKTPKSRSARMLLIRHLVDIESRNAGNDIPDAIAPEDVLISTAQAAAILGYSRPYVAMLIDQNKLKGASVSAGGHRRVSRKAVLDWKEMHQVTDKATSIQSTGKEIGAYTSPEADVVRRVKALRSSRH